MNPSTRVVVFAYGGDTQQVIDMLPIWQHHGCPVTIMSPEDAPVNIPGVDCRSAGEAAHCGPKSHVRTLLHMNLMLEYPEENFFFTESDALCLDPEFPAYLYEERKFWTNGGRDESDLDGRLEARPTEEWYSFQAPWFAHRSIIETMIAAAPKVAYDDRLRWVDLYLSQLVFAAPVPWERFRGAICMPISGSLYNPNFPEWAPALWADGIKIATKSAREGVNFVHSVKTIESAELLVREYRNRFGRNRETVVSIHCYSGDEHMVREHMPAYVHHGQSEVVIISPIDSPVNIEGMTNIHAGKVGYTGQVSLDRQLAQMKALLEAYPEHGFFLLNDSDSAVLDPVIPLYLFEDDVVWSNQVFDGVPDREPFPQGWPTVAFQPPYFLSRQLMEAMVKAGESGDPLVRATGSRPFIDFYMVQLTMVGGLPWKRMKDAISWPISMNQVAHPNAPPAFKAPYAHGLALAQNAIAGGANTVHSVKDGVTMSALVEQRRQYVAGNPDWRPKDLPAPVVGDPTEHTRKRGRQISISEKHIAEARRQRAMLLQRQRYVPPGQKA